MGSLDVASGSSATLSAVVRRLPTSKFARPDMPTEVIDGQLYYIEDLGVIAQTEERTGHGQGSQVHE